MQRKRYLRVAEALRGLIEDGVFRSGDRLPPLRELAERFGVSRATVREALSILRGQGLVEFRHGDGTYVRTAAVETWMEPLEAAILLGAGEARQLAELTVILLAGAAHAAAVHRAQVDWAAVAHRLYQLECAQGQREEAVAAEMAFYQALAAEAGNGLLENALRVLQEATRSMLRLLAEADDRAGLETCRRVFDAAQVGDSLCARNAVYEHGLRLQQRITAHHSEIGRKSG
ncbi:MAG: FadR family transcriptional regulator [Thermoflavifilum sp.]|nr:FadR family transcriptional regulator [Thermoflavifilum sp.]MCL6514175.1 GntR family transcriptional regulator [Alicyclobacillus sp.]